MHKIEIKEDVNNKIRQMKSNVMKGRCIRDFLIDLYFVCVNIFYHNPCVCVSNNSLVHLCNMCHNLRSNCNFNVIFTLYETFHQKTSERKILNVKEDNDNN